VYFMKHMYKVAFCFFLLLQVGIAVGHVFAEDDSDLLPDLYRTQDVNGFMPDRVYLRTMTQTYCKGYNFVVVDGRIYVKKDNDKKWTLFLKTGLPFSKDNKRVRSYFTPPAAVREICADADSLFAFDSEGALYNCYINFGTKEKLFSWHKIFGWPKRSPLVQNDLVRDKRGWSMGVRRKDILWYTDRFGNEHHYGTMGLETVYFLTKDGRHIRFTDSGLPTDFSHSIQCPLDGTFIAENISVSGSTIFLIGSDGSMYTRLIDFDTMGCDPMFFKYTYNYEKQNTKGSDYLSNYTTWALPAEDWHRQPSIPVEGSVRLSKLISIAQTGTGNDARELRVAGCDEWGRIGFYHKQLTEVNWAFTPAPLEIADSMFLDKTISAVAANDNYHYTGYLSLNGVTIPSYTCTVRDVPLTSEGSCMLTISHGSERMNIKLYPVEMWTYMARYNPGFDGTAKNYFVTPQFDSSQFESLSSEFRTVMQDMFDKKNNKLFALSAEATTDYFQVELSGQKRRTAKEPLAKANEYTIFMTKDGYAEVHPDVYKGSLVMAQPLIQQADSPDLILDNNRTYTIRDRSLIQNKIETNKKYRTLLQNEVALYKEYEKKADTSRWGYNAVDLITTITLLNKIDFPKIKTMTSYGSELMNTNARSFASLAGYREWCYSHIIELIDVRIDCFEKMIAQFDDNEIETNLAPRLCNTFPEYLAQVKLPQAADGLSKGIESHLEEITFIPYFPGYLLQINGDVGTTILVELQNSAQKSFARDDASLLSKKPFTVKVNFQTVSAVSPDGQKPAKIKTAGIANISKKKGTLVWNGKTLVIKVSTFPFVKKIIFVGK